VISPEDEFAIRDLYARYNALVDTGNYREWAECFTEDGVFGPAVESGGRAAIAALGKSRFEARASQTWEQPQHWNSGLVLTGDAASASARCCIMRMVRMKDSGETVINVLGTYQDQLAREKGRWLFRVRRVSTDALPAPR
jgi:hypothetical protein